MRELEELPIAYSLPRSKDKYGFSRQIVQTTLEELMSDLDKEKTTQVMKDCSRWATSIFKT